MTEPVFEKPPVYTPSKDHQYEAQKLATGGPIQGSLQSDTIPALLDNGYVIPKRKVSE